MLTLFVTSLTVKLMIQMKGRLYKYSNNQRVRREVERERINVLNMETLKTKNICYGNCNICLSVNITFKFTRFAIYIFGKTK